MLAVPSANESGRPQRRLGLRVPTRAWALLRGGSHGVYALVVELSATGLVLRFARRLREAAFKPEQRFELDVFLPGASAPLHVRVRPVRSIGELEAFELVEPTAVDRLTLAEYIDRFVRAQKHAPFRQNRRSVNRRTSLAGAWKRLLLAPPRSALARSA